MLLRPDALVCCLPDVFAGVFAGDGALIADLRVLDLPTLLFSDFTTLNGRSMIY